MATRLFIVSLFTFFSFHLSAQKFVGFSKNTSLYPNDLKMMLGTNLPKEEEDLLTDFAIDWKGNRYDSLEKRKIVDLSNLMYDHKSRIQQFKQLIALLSAFKESKDSLANYKIWLDYMPVFVSTKKASASAVSNFLESILKVIQGDFVFKTNSLQWKYIGGDHVFKIEKDVFTVNFPTGEMKCYAKRDSISIEETSGKWYPLDHKWIGKNGLVTWERAGFNRNEINVRFTNYTIDLNRSEYKADSALLTYQKYFKQPVLGKLVDMVMTLQSPESATYPQFETYNKRFIFNNLYPNIDYDGGFAMRGSKVIGAGTDVELAKIVVRRDKKTLMEVRSKYFVFRPDRVNGINTIVKILLEKDSIFHSSLSFIYYVDKQEVNLLRTENFASLSPYYNSYHKLDMDFEQLTWRITEPRINLTMSRASAIGKAKFQSQNFYNQTEFEAIQGQDSYHPLVELRRFSRRIDSPRFTATSFAEHVGRTLSEVRQVLMTIAKEGFIYYNTETDVVTTKQRLVDYLKSAAGSIDYDVVNFNSATQAPLDNAVLDMDNLDLSINGIPRIAVSDSQNVIIYPANEQIIMKQNRSFQFDGRIDAGLFTIYGNNFFFDYNSFKINLQNVDSISVKVFSGEVDELGRPITRQVKSVIQHITGEIQIDKPDNKSGLKNYPEYPLFASRENSFIYYQAKEIENNVYPEESFYFELYPFTIDSLDNFKKEGMNFRGKFQSSGILPAIEQNLVLRPDYSLGFKYTPGPDGIPVYEGKGTLYGNIDLSNKGLRSDGKLKFITSTTTSREFKFYPDSMNTQSDAFTIEQRTTGVQFPKENSSGNYIHWATTLDNRMTIKQGKEPFRMFNEKTSLTGTLMLEPKGLSGKGLMNLTTADLESKDFKYKAEIIDADTARFLLKSLKKEGYTVLTEENVNSHVDFSIHKGEFVSNEDYTKVDFPENKYISFLDYFKWNMEERTLEMSARRTTSVSKVKREDKAKFEEKFRYEEETDGPRYISVHNKQDSLNFVSPSAVYDYQNNLINAANVKLIRVADAVVYPQDGKVTVEEAAVMKTLYNTKIVANYKDRYHTLYAADINIQGRKSLTGHGKYDYIDETEKAQAVTMTDIYVDPNIHVIAKGNILEPDSFTLSPYFGYQGKVTLRSTKALLDFDGGVAIKTDCDRLRPDWLRFETEIDPKNVEIPVSDAPVSINNRPLYNGIFIAPDSIHIYPAFLSGRRGYNDQLITTSSGILRYNKDSSIYEIASKEKLLNRDTILGNYLNFHKFNCVEYGESKIELGANLGQMKLGAYGTASMNLVSKEVNLDVNLTVDFMFDPTIMKMMAVKIDSFPNLGAVDLNRPLLSRSWSQTLGKARAQKYKDEMTLLGKPKEFPAELEHTINFTSLHLKWDAVNKAYQSVGKIGVGNILNYQVNRMVDGFIQITRKRSGDLMDIYLKLDDNNYYYFGYSRGVMQAYSTSSTFLEALRNLSIKARQMDVKRGETPYTYMVTSDTRFGNFLRDYKRTMKSKTQGEENQIIEPENHTDTESPPVTQPAAEKATEPDLEKDKVQDKEKEKSKDSEKKDTQVEEKPTEEEVIEVK